MHMAKTIFIIFTSNFATLQKPVFSKRCFAQKHPQPSLALGENFMQNASFQKTLKTTYHTSSVDETCPKQIYSMKAVHFQVNSWMNSPPSQRIKYDGLAQTGVLSYNGIREKTCKWDLWTARCLFQLQLSPFLGGINLFLLHVLM